MLTQNLYRNLPSLLVKILGVYQVSWRRHNGDKLERMHVFVMANLFYGKRITRVFDLKGSVRNRYIKVSSTLALAHVLFAIDCALFSPGVCLRTQVNPTIACCWM